PDAAFEHERHDLESLVGMQADRAVDHGLRPRPVKQARERPDESLVLRESHGLVLDDLAVVERAIGLVGPIDDSHDKTLTRLEGHSLSTAAIPGYRPAAHTYAGPRI